MQPVQAQLVRRNATLVDLVALLREQQAGKLDVVIPATALHCDRGVWEIVGIGAVVLNPEGVTTTAGRFVPTAVCDAGIADKLAIPTA